ncbi:recombinase family protein [Variovorax sp. VNK109]|uniref:recombinase family protein n=1 Tax=Variovorax sp. VNK109 TaxID=3400919 RepID=UPI003BFBB7B4
MSVRPIRCAIYTRKSSEEGLDQSFNSIDAQREACEAYILSQRHEGWVVLPTRYDDGGFSGGTLDRPAVQTLLTDIKDGAVDLVVVYKIDRLTRSLADFAKMVEVFDAHSASFVSVTQHFNTTSSMGRLTLNVLLSFAQFEREVTGERIRDKIAASKKKGMWMGGTVPLGYDAVDRKLVINQPEAELVRKIYELYLETGNVRMVQTRLRAMGAVSKVRLNAAGKSSGGAAFRPGAIYKILNNRIYLGEVPHKDVWYAGAHEAILEEELFKRVQDALAIGLDRRRKGVHAKEPSLLAGWVRDKDGNILMPSHALKKGKRYRYYVTRPRDMETDEWAPRISIPAHDIEKLVIEATSRWLLDAGRMLNDLHIKDWEPDARMKVLKAAERYAERLRQGTHHEQRELLLPLITWVQVYTEEVRICFRRQGTLSALWVKLKVDEKEDRLDEDAPVVSVDARLQRYGLEMRLIVNEEWATIEEPEIDPHLVLGLARGHKWFTELRTGAVSSIAAIAKREKVSGDFVGKTLRGAFLAPELVERMLEGRITGWSSKRLQEPAALNWALQLE